MAHGGSAVAAAIANAIKASGVVGRVQPEDFANILRRVDKPAGDLPQGRVFHY
jgi:GGDEF domain-containing protein